MFELLLLLACKQSSYFKQKSLSGMQRVVFPLSHLNWKYTTILYLGHACVSKVLSPASPHLIHSTVLCTKKTNAYWVRGKAGRTISRNFSPDSHQHLPIPCSAQTEAFFDYKNHWAKEASILTKLLPLHDVIQVSKTAWGYVHVRLMTSTTPGNFNLSRWRYRAKQVVLSHSETSKTGED